ncbi:MAG: gamma carbonic anhydrase family protein [Conchiformibius sp.]|nr:gamma carbonic anhydrase family protein [Conchiformibius sp.]
MSLRSYLDSFPQIADGCYIDEAAVIIGDVVVGGRSSVWPCAVIRGDVNSVRIGKRSNIQDGAVLHVSHKTEAKPEGSPLTVGDDVTVGHRAVLHGCTVGNRVLIGSGSVVLDDAVIEDDVMIAAGSLIPPRKRLESGWLYKGAPAVQVRRLNGDELENLRDSAAHYVLLAGHYSR